MPPQLHSAISASGFARDLACPGNRKRQRAVSDGTRRSSIYSAEGTLAHAMVEAALASGTSCLDLVGQTRTADGFTFDIDDELAEAAAVYQDFILGLRGLGFVVALEVRVDPSIHWPDKPHLGVDLFGTSDCIAYHPALKLLVIVDLKFGKGVAVNVQGNAQLLYYAAGSLWDAWLTALCESAGEAFLGVDTVRTIIVQPRAWHRDGPIRQADYPADTVRTWAREVLYPGARRALDDDGSTIAAGSHCRFCAAAAHCEGPRQTAIDVARAAFLASPPEIFVTMTDPNQAPVPQTGRVSGDLLPEISLSNAELGQLLAKMEVIKPWLKAVQELADARLDKGESIPGWKRVPGRATRKWADTDENVAKALAAAGLDPDDVLDTRLRTPAQIEKAVGKAAYAADVAPHVVKHSSSTSLVPDEDPRRAVGPITAQDAFGITAKP